MARPDIAIGDHPELGIVASTTAGVPAAKVLLSRLGFARDNDTDLYVLLPDEPGRPDTRPQRAARAISVLRAADFRVDADITYEPEAEPAPAPARRTAVRPDVAFGRHPEQGITAAITGERPYAAMILRAAGFTRDPERDVYTLSAKLSRRAASTIARNTADVLRESGADVRVLPGTVADATPVGRRGARIAPLLDGPHGARAMLASLRQFLQTASAWCADRTATGAGFLADRFLSAAARLDLAAHSLEHTSTRLRAHDDAASVDTGTSTAPSDGAIPEATGPFDKLAAELREAPDEPAAAEVLARVTAKDGPLDQLQRIVAAAAEQSAQLPPPVTAEVTEPLVDAVVRLTDVRDTLARFADRLAAPPTAAQPAPAHREPATTEATGRTSTTEVARAARTTPTRRAADDNPPTDRRAAAAAVPAAARPAPASRRR